MAKITVIQIIQRVLSALDSDNVSSIGDSVESEQVKDILDTVYDRLLDDYPWDHLKEYGQLEVTPVANQMKLPNNILQVDHIRYNKKDVSYILPLEMTKRIDSAGILTDKDPTYWTSYDDDYIVFDSYNGSLVSVLSNCSFVRKPLVLLADSDVPDMPDRLHTVLLDGVLEEAFRILKGDEQTAQIYFRKYIVGLGKAKRWAKRVNFEDSTYGNSYGRRYN